MRGNILLEQKISLFLNMSFQRYICWIVTFLIIIFLTIFLILFFSWSEPYPFTDEEIQKGQREIETSRVIFAGLVRDKEDRVPYIKKRLEALGEPFKDYHILIVENDSEDQTRERLLEWQRKTPKVTILGCGENVKKCQLELEATKVKTFGSNRIKKMAYLRNIYVDYVHEHFGEWDYLVVNDLDLLADLSDKGWKSAFGNFRQDPSLSAISAYGYYDLWFKKMFYDDFAFVPLGSSIERSNSKATHFGIKEKIEMERYQLETKKELVPVKSSFSGLTVYRLSHVPKKARYDYCHSDGKHACEHSYFNQHLNKIVVHPGLKYRIINNKV
uniref:Glycosyltransferase n=1 Tax=Pithovirus LCPAC304 TaxID=2506594 RepID=A0A481ZAX3_9VIRU|nr:MAG: glycosyltransferase [Pithovirus LCPAC304]